MASLSQQGDVLTLHLVYDGPPESGKTSSLRTLAGSLGRPLQSPEEVGGRTLYFDWVEYTGGSFEGIPIRCQIVSVPGQRALARRRERLLAEADVVVFVADSTAANFSASEKALDSLRRRLEAGPTPRPGIVVQANKRDHSDALPISDLRSRLAPDGVALVESVAIAGSGIREAFVLAVRLALDRVRELRAAGALSVGPPAAESADDLLRQMREVETERAQEHLPAGPDASECAGSPAAEPDAQEAASVAATAGEDSERSNEPATPRLPDGSVPSGRVWPPIEGRILLHNASSSGAIPRLHPDGSWRAQEGNWWFHSAPEHEFEQPEDGKQELLRWAQLHAGNFSRLSSQRCLVFSESAPGRWRLWQIVLAQPSLRQRLLASLRRAGPRESARSLLAVCNTVLRARTLFGSEPVLPCLLEVIGEGAAGPLYVGLLPLPTWKPSPAELEEDDVALLRRVLGPSIRRAVTEGTLDVPQVLNAMSNERSRRDDPAPLAEMLVALLIGS